MEGAYRVGPGVLHGRLVVAHGTLLRGAGHVRSDIGAIWNERRRVECPRGLWLRARVTANALRELDRFLNLLLDAAAEHAGLHADGGRRHTPNKLQAFQAAFGAPDPHHHALMSIGRARDCLFHCRGVVRRADRGGGAHLTLAWREPHRRFGRRVAIGERLDLTPRDMCDIGSVYEQVADRLRTLTASS